MLMRMSIPSRILVAVAAASCASLELRTQQVRREYVELHMGVAVRIVVYAPNDATARRAARAAYARIAELEDIMSDFRPESEVRRLAERPHVAVPVSEHLSAVLERALELARLSEGAFDPTVGPFVELWRQARRTGRLPSSVELDSAALRVGWHKVHLDPDRRTVRLDVPGMRLDLGGIAKGYILDQGKAELRQHGVAQALLEAGGDIVAGDPPPGLPGWRVAIPEGGPALRARTAALANAAVATSGDTEQFVLIEGVRYSHVIDPRTGLGLTTRRQATVVAPDGATADGLATALTVLDDARGAALLKSFPDVVAAVRR
jgi:FAD:protein FMN transferase